MSNFPIAYRWLEPCELPEGKEVKVEARLLQKGNHTHYGDVARLEFYHTDSEKFGRVERVRVHFTNGEVSAVKSTATFHVRKGS